MAQSVGNIRGGGRRIDVFSLIVILKGKHPGDRWETGKISNTT